MTGTIGFMSAIRVVCPVCPWDGEYPEQCPEHRRAYRPVDPETAKSVRTPMELDAPAASEDYKTLYERSQETVKSLRSRITARDKVQMDQFDMGVKHGRESERREIANRLDANASRLSGNGSSARDKVVRSVLRAVAAQLRSGLAREKEDTG